MQGKRFYCCIESLTLWQIALLPELLVKSHCCDGVFVSELSGGAG